MTFGEWLRWFSNLFVKEFLTYFIDPASRFILVVPLIIQIFLFGYTATFDLNHAPIAVLNESHGRFSQQLISQIGASPTFYIRRYLDNASQMKDELNPRDSLAIVHIQSDFDSKPVPTVDNVKIKIPKYSGSSIPRIGISNQKTAKRTTIKVCAIPITIGGVAFAKRISNGL